MDRRRSRRWPRQLDVRFWKHGEEGDATRAISTNVSKTGLFVRTNQVLPSGARLRLEISCAGRTFVSEGIVMRALRSPPHLQAAFPSGMGVRFLRIEELLEDLLPGINLLAEERIPGGAQTPPPSPPITQTTQSATSAYSSGVMNNPARAMAPTPPPQRPITPSPEPIRNSVVFPLRFRDREQFQRAFARDIQTGGLFISTQHPPPMDAVVDVEVSIDGSKAPPVRLQARVVHRLEPQPGGDSTNLLVGAGVQFVDVGRAVEQLRALLSAY